MGGGASKDTEAQLDSDCSDQQSQDQVLVDEHVPSEFHGDNSLVAVKVEPLTNSLPTNGASFRPKHRFQPIRDSVRSEAPQLEDMVVELKKVNWHRLGIQLRVPPDRLDKIEEDYRSADRKLSEVLTYWLLNEIDPSWNKICEALGRIGEYGNIVREIKMNYCSIDKLRMFTRRCQHYESKPTDSEENVDLQLSCEVNPQIDVAITELQRNFRECVSAIRLTFTNTLSGVKKLLRSELPAGEVKGQVGLLLTQSANMRAILESADIDQLFITLSNINAWDFLHPQLLEYLVQELGENQAKEQMQCYKSTLLQFRNQTKMSELSGWFGNIPENPLFQKVVLKLGDGWKDKSYQQFEELRVSILRQQVFNKSTMGFCGALTGSVLVALCTSCDINVAALVQALKSPSLSMFMKDNEISSVYAKGICLVRDVGLIQESLTTLTESEEVILTDTESTTDPSIDIFTDVDSGQTEGSEIIVVSTAPSDYPKPKHLIHVHGSILIPSEPKTQILRKVPVPHDIAHAFSETYIDDRSDTSAQYPETLITPASETHPQSRSLLITPTKLLPRSDMLESYYKQRVEDLEEQLKSQRKEFTEFRAASSETMKELEERMKISEERMKKSEMRMKESEEKVKKLEKMLEQMQVLPLKS